MVVALKEVPVGGSVSAQLKGKPIIVSRPAEGRAVAFTAICTHQGCTVKPADAKLLCPCHGSIFDALTGKNLSGPAPKPLAAIPVTVSAGNVIAT
ncbi:ubiquinol-cytochrome c reductase iron-sulfur subunit [uncultured Friedmanniella sp.]|uniref:QcrA and Rieske domain-containing protein n=1 Tax=uncultured Friedmanniella sp. TaxID=335381 RepID=UPI0035CB0EB1